MGILTDDYGYYSPFKCFVATALTLVLAMGSCEVLNRYTYSEGARSGVINKFSNKGWLFKTWEGQLALEGIVSSGTHTGANVWDFSLDRGARHGEDVGALAEEMQHYLEQGCKVELEYIEPGTTWPWRSETDYLVQRVTPTGNCSPLPE
ncbi:MAG: hypothetical protein OXR66_01955 [Candidatus Woesearchaeota archaeon]|nr:hypothetical protein [Candidatus Woesearchaeota archaeon]